MRVFEKEVEKHMRQEGSSTWRGILSKRDFEGMIPEKLIANYGTTVHDVKNAYKKL